MSAASSDDRAEAPSADVIVTKVIALVEELIALIGEENRALARGMPASLAGSTRRKTALAEDFERWVMHVDRHRICGKVADPALRQRLVERITVLQTAMDENVAQLRRAIAASQRRVDAIMRVIREEIASRTTTYGCTGVAGAASSATSCLGKGVCA